MCVFFQKGRGIPALAPSFCPASCGIPLGLFLLAFFVSCVSQSLYHSGIICIPPRRCYVDVHEVIIALQRLNSNRYKLLAKYPPFHHYHNLLPRTKQPSHVSWHLSFEQ